MKRYSEMSRSIRPFKVNYYGRWAGMRSFTNGSEAHAFMALCDKLGLTYFYVPPVQGRER